MFSLSLSLSMLLRIFGNIIGYCMLYCEQWQSCDYQNTVRLLFTAAKLSDSQ